MSFLSAVGKTLEKGCDNWDLPGFSSGSIFSVRGNTVGQSFSRRFSAIDYKLQRQELHREDIRDIIELTTGRMGIYHVVGTLLLDFCISWYTDNTVLQGRLPIWFNDLFYISNFAAVGFLLLCVWLAMYAAIAARSIGVRLLTSYARLSLPSKKELDDIKNPIFFNTMDVVRRQRQKMRRLAPTPEDTVSNVPLPTDDAEEETPTEDDQQHFRKILEELPKWINYDIWSRVCMSFGMNQLIQALSYFVLAVVWERSPLCAVMSFVAVKFLGYVVLLLDVGDLTLRTRDLLALTFLNLLPPVLTTVLICIQDFDVAKSDDALAVKAFKENVSVLSTICFFAHAGWLFYLFELLSHDDKTNLRFKPTTFARVLEWVNFKSVNKNSVKVLEGECIRLVNEMKQVVKSETKSGLVSIDGRSSAKLRWLVSNVSLAKKDIAGKSSNTKAQLVLERAEQVLARFEVWSKAAEVLASLEAFRSQAVHERLTPANRELIDESYDDFLIQCQGHSLGICVDESESGESVTPLSIAPADRFVVRIDGSEGAKQGERERIWIDTSNNKVLTEAPTGGWWSAGRPVTDLHSSIFDDLYCWKKRIGDLECKAPVTLSSWEPDPSNTGNLAPRRPDVNGGRRPGTWMGSASKEGLAQPFDGVPTHVVRLFTMTVITWWILAGFMHAFTILFVQRTTPVGRFTGAEEIDHPNEEEVQRLVAEWPAPAKFLKIHSLHCSEEQVWVSSQSSVYETALSAPTGKPIPLKFARKGGLGAILCNDLGCDSLSPPAKSAGNNAPWVLAPLVPPGKNEAAHVPIPPTWRLVAGAWTEECPRAAAALNTCDSGWLVGWDGVDLIAATLLRDEATGAWAVTPLFDVDLALGIGAGGGKTDRNFSPPPSYANVNALQLGAGGRALMVLHDHGAVDAWDLFEGVVRGRLHLGEDVTSICFNNKSVLLARGDRGGPRLVTRRLPPKIAKLLYPNQQALVPNTSDFGEDQGLALRRGDHHRPRRRII